MAPEQHTLIKLLANISNKWQEIGIALSIEQNFLDGLSKSLDSNEIKLTKVIEKWMNTQSSHATWETVISAIEGPIVNNKNKADELRRHIGKLI